MSGPTQAQAELAELIEAAIDQGHLKRFVGERLIGGFLLDCAGVTGNPRSRRRRRQQLLDLGASEDLLDRFRREARTLTVRLPGEPDLLIELD